MKITFKNFNTLKKILKSKKSNTMIAVYFKMKVSVKISHMKIKIVNQIIILKTMMIYHTKITFKKLNL